MVYVFLFVVVSPAEHFSGWCLCCCPLWCGLSRFRSVIRKVRRSRKASSSSAWCYLSCCRKPSASHTTSCSSKKLFPAVYIKYLNSSLVRQLCHMFAFHNKSLVYSGGYCCDWSTVDLEKYPSQFFFFLESSSPPFPVRRWWGSVQVCSTFSPSVFFS